MRLLEWFEGAGGALVALSGGVDSAVVAHAARAALGPGAVAVTADYQTLASEELESARQAADQIGIEHIVLRYSELEDEAFVRNGPDRCFHCRTELAARLSAVAAQRGIPLIADGTHAGDAGEHRPGIGAMHAAGVRSPLAELGIAKDGVRAMARAAGLSVHDRPSNACLASRIPWGQRVTSEKLLRIELGERMVREKLGLRQVRVRDSGGRARIEVEPSEVRRAGRASAELAPGFAVLGFSSLEVDPRGYAPGGANP